ncbi:Ion transport protein-domain-containing protein [Kockovaella imperatae]|uniref:Ion transport protein-domain-containing protein n=1 Tax=Kockovaella imperatae TaxID=4999 RepID=A0A1Y1UPW7_9TREE|nr:Ion transport protein-domain-containing protein [Kockovaella imperatae]ORX40063.1 Ion transport protein-domain-containing protein [Kockovaella imperatae]
MSYPSTSHSNDPPIQRRDSLTSVVLSTSRTPSPSASPISPIGPGFDGLSKRHSWSRERSDDMLGGLRAGPSQAIRGQQGQGSGLVVHGLGLSSSPGSSSSSLGLDHGAPLPSGRGLPPGRGTDLDMTSSRVELMAPEEEYALGSRNFYEASTSRSGPFTSTAGTYPPLNRQDTSTSTQYPSYYFHPEDRGSNPRPYFHPFQSDSSLEHGTRAGHDTPPEDEEGMGDIDRQRLTSAPPVPGSSQRRQHSRVRNPTLRSVSKTIRKASIRVVNTGGINHEGMSRLPDEDEEYEDDRKDDRKEDTGFPVTDLDSASIGPKPPEGPLRGKTLGIFGPRSPIRTAMHSFLNYPYTEPFILLLIVLNVIFLCIQGSEALYSPRADDGYFQSWEDYAIFALFVVFTLEMFARILVTGLLIDPETSLRQVLFDEDGLVPLVSRRFTRAQHNLSRSTSRKTSNKSWRVPSDPIPKVRKPNTISLEAPFQKAVARQKALSAQGRPYLRHSWHRIDMMAVVSFWIMFVLALLKVEATDTRHIYIFRALSVLRAGRLLVITTGTTTILHSLKRAVPMLITVGFFLIFAFTIFSIIGVQSFRGSFRRICVLPDPQNTTHEIQLTQQCGGYIESSLQPAPYITIDNTSAGGAAKGFVCPLDQTCITATFNPEGDSMSFDNVFAALVQVVTITVVNGWAPIMYAAMDSDYFGSCLYFIVAVLVLNFWFLNLLTAVVVNTFQDIRAETKKSAFGAVDESDTKLKKATGTILSIYNTTEMFWVVLILASLIAQACKTSHSSPQFLTLLNNLELAFTFAFDVEIAIRIAGHFPDWKSFLFKARNSYDLFLAIACSIIQIPAIANSSIYQWLTVFQLLRWYRVILAFPRMRPLLNNVFGSFAGLWNMVIFLMLINLIAALAAMQLFRGDVPADDIITISQTFNAFLGAYQVFSSENWTALLYAVMEAEIPFKQRWLGALFWCAWILFAYAIVLQMFIAVINENFAVAEEQKRKRQMEAFIRRAEPAHVKTSWIDRLNPYRYLESKGSSVKVDALPANLVLPIKPTIGPDVAINRLFGRGDKTEAIPLRRLGIRSHGIDDGEDDDRGLSDLLPPMSAGPSEDEHADALRERRNQQADFINAHPTYDQSLWIFKQSNPIRKFCQACVSPAHGDRIFGRPVKPIYELVLKLIIFCMIVASISVAAVATPEYRKQYYSDRGVRRDTWFDLAEVALGMVFIVEAGIKIIADGFIFAPNAYLLSLWNVMDFLILITLLVNTTTSLIYIGGLSRLTRSLKAFRALRLITLFSRMRETLHILLFAGAMKLLDASILMALYLIPFAVWGLNIFSGTLFSCNDPNATGITDCVGEYMFAPIDESIPFLMPRVWANPTLDESIWAFDSFRESILILFEIVSLEGWIDVMESAMAIVGIGKQSQNNASQWNAIFFVLFNLFGAVVILTLFLSVIIGNFSTRSGDALLTREQRHWVDMQKFIKAQTPSQLPNDVPRYGLRAWCCQRATQKHGFWTRSFTIIYCIHIVLLSMEDFSNNIITDLQLDWIFIFMTVLYAVDLLVRFYGLGLKSFRANGWNLYDFVVVVGSFATTIPALQAEAAGTPGSEWGTQLQKLFLVAIPFKLVQRIDSLNQLFKTSVASLPAIGNLFLLWATFFIFFGMMFLEVFGLTKMGNNAGTRFQNYYRFSNSLVMLAFMSTGADHFDSTLSVPRCTESSNYLDSDCGSAAWAYGLYIFANMFTGVVVESFRYVYQMPGHASLNREEMRSFKKLWAEFDTERTGYIRRKDFVRFFSRLRGIWEVRLYPVEYSIPNLMRGAVPDPVAKAAGRLLVVTGVRQAVDMGIVQSKIKQIDYAQVHDRRQTFARLFHEARITEEKGRGISFTNMLMMLAHYRLIDDEKALLLDDLLARREKKERVTDLVNLDRVRGLLRTIYWRRRFLNSRRTLKFESNGIPAIVLDPMPLSPPEEGHQDDPFDRERERSQSPSSSRDSSRVSSPEAGNSSLARDTWGQHRHGASLGVVATRPSLSRQSSNASMLSSDDAHYRSRDSSLDEVPLDYDGEASNSIWGGECRRSATLPHGHGHGH